MKLGNPLKLRVEDLDNPPKWAEQLLNNINSNFDKIFNVLNNATSFPDNIDCQIKTLTVKSAALPLVINNPIARQPIGIWVLKLYKPSNPAYIITDPISISWHMSSNGISIDSISGIMDTDDYTITIIVI